MWNIRGLFNKSVTSRKMVLLSRVIRGPAQAGHVLLLSCMFCCPATCPNRPAFFQLWAKSVYTRLSSRNNRLMLVRNLVQSCFLFFFSCSVPKCTSRVPTGLLSKKTRITTRLVTAAEFRWTAFMIGRRDDNLYIGSPKKIQL